MANLSSANATFLMIEIIMMLAVLFMWAFWTLEQWREKLIGTRRFAMLRIIQRK